ncbi:hypothetical protein J8J14_23735 [Roseomonas sp. SSH11]|uniref:Uncharacterized protein n=1 Tax=Pararoseomonas baculiformis TaxID=2820812 RepID=A0ABS4AL51_9PROT|nr:hypothetical protein [Pararoseomonas baculiformis]MBP0447763.1 hypothetical protein [Pararoseomonas baculiformis]
MHEPDLNRTPRRAALDELEDDAAFEEFWRLYPRREGRGAARRAWDIALRRADRDAEGILVGLRSQLHRLSPPSAGGVDFRPYPATWLRDERWRDGEEPDGLQFLPAAHGSTQEAT